MHNLKKLIRGRMKIEAADTDFMKEEPLLGLHESIRKCINNSKTMAFFGVNAAWVSQASRFPPVFVNPDCTLSLSSSGSATLSRYFKSIALAQFVNISEAPHQSGKKAHLNDSHRAQPPLDTVHALVSETVLDNSLTSSENC